MDDNKWNKKLVAFLHDPPTKAVLIAKMINHEEKAAELAESVGLGRSEELQKMVRESDQLAAKLDRPPFRTETGFKQLADQYLIKNPFGCKKEGSSLEKSWNPKSFMADTNKIHEALRKKLNSLKDLPPMIKYLALWRLLPEWAGEMSVLPADTRIPTHNIIDHLDITAAIEGGKENGKIKIVLLKLSPVQPFINSSRKLSDLWASSHILSSLMLGAIEEIIKINGPDAVIFPYLRGQPMVDWILAKKYFKDHEKDEWYKDWDKIRKDKKRSDYSYNPMSIASIPNRLLAIVPPSLKEESLKDAIKEKAKEIAEKTVKEMEEKEFPLDDKVKDQIIKEFCEFWQISVSSVTINMNDSIEKNPIFKWFFSTEEGKTYRNYYELLKQLSANSTVLYSKWDNPLQFYGLIYLYLNAKLAEESSKDALNRKVLNGNKQEVCTLCNQNYAILSDNSISKEWEPIIKHKERLCSVCLIKRFYRFYAEKEGFSPRFKSFTALLFPERVEKWKEEIKRFKDSHPNSPSIPLSIKDDDNVLKEVWEKTKERLENRNKWDELIDQLNNLHKKWKEEINKYYALLRMDGDKMGRYLSGEQIRPLSDLLVIDKNQWIRNLRNSKGITHPEEIIEKLRTVGLLTPSIHHLISRDLLYFSIVKVPEIVDAENGMLIYSGGDDILAVFPSLEKAMKAASKISEEFGLEWIKIRFPISVNKDINKYFTEKTEKNVAPFAFLCGTMSGSIIASHYKYPFWDVLTRSKDLEGKSKSRAQKGNLSVSSARPIQPLGGNNLTVLWIAKSGDLKEFWTPWDVVQAWVSGEFLKKHFFPFCSDRFMRDLLGELQYIEDEKVFKILLRYELKRHVNREEEKMEEIKNNLEQWQNFYNTFKGSSWKIAYEQILKGLIVLQNGLNNDDRGESG